MAAIGKRVCQRDWRQVPSNFAQGRSEGEELDGRRGLAAFEGNHKGVQRAEIFRFDEQEDFEECERVSP